MKTLTVDHSKNACSVRQHIFQRSLTPLVSIVRRELIVIEDLPFAGIVDPVSDALHRRIEAVHRDQTDRRIVRALRCVRPPLSALPGVDGEFHPHLGRRHRACTAADQSWPTTCFDGLDVAAGHRASPVLLPPLTLGPSPCILIACPCRNLQPRCPWRLRRRGSGKFVRLTRRRCRFPPRHRGAMKTSRRNALPGHAEAALKRLGLTQSRCPRRLGAGGNLKSLKTGRINSCQFSRIILFHPATCRRSHNIHPPYVGRYLAAGDTGSRQLKIHTRRRLRGRHPLCGIVVTSRDLGQAVNPPPYLRAQRRFTARPRTGDLDLEGLHAVFLGLLGRIFGRHLGGIRRRLAVCRKATWFRRDDQAMVLPCTSSVVIAGIVERRVHMRDAGGDVFSFAPPDAGKLYPFWSSVAWPNRPTGPVPKTNAGPKSSRARFFSAIMWSPPKFSVVCAIAAYRQARGAGAMLTDPSAV